MPSANSLANLKPPWKPGKTGNPTGKNGAATRQDCEYDFWRVLAADFHKHGEKAIRDCREADPIAYVKTVASLMPKDMRVEVKRSVTGLSPDELLQARDALRSLVDARNGGARSSEPQVIDVSPVSETG